MEGKKPTYRAQIKNTKNLSTIILFRWGVLQSGWDIWNVLHSEAAVRPDLEVGMALLSANHLVCIVY